jgi:hypothetical protein
MKKKGTVAEKKIPSRQATVPIPQQQCDLNNHKGTVKTTGNPHINKPLEAAQK